MATHTTLFAPGNNRSGLSLMSVWRAIYSMPAWHPLPIHERKAEAVSASTGVALAMPQAKKPRLSASALMLLLSCCSVESLEFISLFFEPLYGFRQCVVQLVDAS